MKNKNNIFIIIGFLIYLILSITDRFFLKINPYIYIPIALFGILFIIIGIFKDRKKLK